MVKRGEIRAVSIGYNVSEWKITDEDGREVPEDRVRWNDDGMTFTAKRWQLVECSLVGVPVDAAATLRNADVVYTPNVLQDTLVRMQMRHALVTGICDDRDITPCSIFVLDDIRQRMLSRQNMIDRQSGLHRSAENDDDGFRRVYVPPRGLTFYAPAGPIP
jgi:hypothetical protein